MNLDPTECVMVGNDAIEDIAATKTGMQVFMITKNLLNGDKVDMSKYPQGDFEDFINWMK